MHSSQTLTLTKQSLRYRTTKENLMAMTKMNLVEQVSKVVKFSLGWIQHNIDKYFENSQPTTLNMTLLRSILFYYFLRRKFNCETNTVEKNTPFHYDAVGALRLFYWVSLLSFMKENSLWPKMRLKHECFERWFRSDWNHKWRNIGEQVSTTCIREERERAKKKQPKTNS